MQAFQFARSVNRTLIPLLKRAGGDGLFHYRMAYPVAAGLALLPGDRGLYFGEIARFLDKSRRSRSAAQEFETRVACLDATSVVLDLGANVGVFTERLARQGATVHAFEPDPWTFGRLQARVAGMENVRLHNRAVGAQNGRLTFHRDPGFEGDPEGVSVGGTLLNRSDFSDGTQFEVDVIRLVEFLDGLDRDIDLIKMDIEGAELDVLTDLLASPVLKRVKAIFVETHLNLFPEQICPIAHLRRAYAAAGRPYVNFDWH
ncbi:MAG: FkbM family methyltransferase [Rhodobacteraceae bacterium]|nr:FkbM family methyltransferase [Paracoccaceae bacterium]